MKAENTLHIIQREILMYLLFHTKSRFSEINVKKISSDSFDFHIKRLIQEGFVEKTDDLYTLTIQGKEYANRFDTQKAQIEKQAKLAVLLVAMRNHDGQDEYLLQQRLKQPYYGHIGFLTGKIGWGETLEEAAKREFVEETGLTGSFTLVGMKHKMDYASQEKLLEDKYFFTFAITHTKGHLIEVFDAGKNIWLTKSALAKTKNLFDGVMDTIALTKTKSLQYTEDKFIVKSY